LPESEPYAPVIADAIKELNIETSCIGIEGDFMPAPAYQRLLKELPEATFKPSNIIHELKRVKSPEELRFVEKGVEMVDRACETCFEIARPGKTWNEISSIVVKSLYDMGIEDIGGFPLPRSTSITKPGDSYLFYPEIQAPGGYWIQFGRSVSFGEPKKEWRDAWELSIEAQKRGAEKLRPGNTGADVAKVINEALKGTKYTGASRGSGHGVGLDVFEKPMISLDDETVLKPGEVITIHPIFSPRLETRVAIADMFVVTEGEPRKLSRISPEIKVI
jgi:Xaa-Pro aminopeptidase